MPGNGNPTLKWSTAALADLQRLRAFLQPHSPDAARRAAASLNRAATLLMEHPGMGSRLEGRQDRELFVPFGQRGYVLRYRLDGDDIVILRIWHGLENR